MNPITKLRSYLQRLAQMENDYVELVATTADLLTHMSELTARLTQQAEQMKHLSQQNERLRIYRKSSMGALLAHLFGVVELKELPIPY